MKSSETTTLRGVLRPAVRVGLRLRLPTAAARRQRRWAEMAAASRLPAYADLSATRTVVVRAHLTPRDPIAEHGSTLGRELAFVISHTIHHNAAIALLVHGLGHRRLPPRFGLAPGSPALAGAA